MASKEAEQQSTAANLKERGHQCRSPARHLNLYLPEPRGAHRVSLRGRHSTGVLPVTLDNILHRLIFIRDVTRSIDIVHLDFQNGLDSVILTLLMSKTKVSEFA